MQLDVSNICHVNDIFRTGCCTITNRPIDLKLGLNIQSRVMHVSNKRFFEIPIASCNFMQFKDIYLRPFNVKQNEPSARLAKLFRSPSEIDQTYCSNLAEI